MPQSSTDESQWIRNAVHDKHIFLVLDKSILSGIQYFHILVGSVETSHASYLSNYQSLPCAPNYNSIAQAVNNGITSLRINKNSFYLLLFDVPKYRVAAGATLKSVFHKTCVAELLHNCAVKVKSHFESLDQLIAKVK